MDINERIRTSRGQYPVLFAKLGFDEMTGVCCLRFCFRSDVVSEQGPSSLSTASPISSIADIAYLVSDRGGKEEVRISKLVSIASNTGPLFGFPENEGVGDWLAESFLAGTVLAVQAAINDSLFEGMGEGLGVSGCALVPKLIVSSNSLKKSFRLYSIDIPLPDGVSDSFFRGMPDFPSVRTSRMEGSADYVVLLFGRDGEHEVGGEEGADGLPQGIKDEIPVEKGLHIQALLFSFDEDISKADFGAVLKTFGLLEETNASELLGFDGEPENLTDKSPGYGLSESLHLEEADLSSEDAPHLQKLVHALMSLRLRGIGVDLFESTAEDAYMVFPSYASFLWYQLFAQLCNVELGLCEECGKRFVLTGHRGSKRKYCSEECKAKAKNVRSRKARDDARKFFLEDGLSVEQVARAIYGWNLMGEDARCERRLRTYMELIRKQLRGYPLLKRNIDALLRDGTDLTPIVRFVEQGIFSWSYIFERAERVSSKETCERIHLMSEVKPTRR